MPTPTANTPAADHRSAPTGALLYWLAALGVIGLLYGPFLFSNRVGILDWSKDLFYFAFLHDSLRSFGQLPLSFLAIPHSIAWFSTLQDLSYWSNPEVISFSPLLPLAFVMPVVAFMKTYFGLHLLAAAWGIRLLAGRCGFGPVRALVLLVLFLGNPWLVQHLAIGYSPQISLCLIPLIVALLAAREFRPLEWAGAAALAALVCYQGALHLFVWLLLAVGVFVAFEALLARRLDHVWRTVFFFAATAGLVAPKAYAAASVYGGWRRIPAGGYASLADLWGLLTDAGFPMFQFPETYSHYNVAFYDGSLLVGPGFVVLTGLAAGAVLFAALRRREADAGRITTDAACLLAALTFLVLGWGSVWRDLAALLHLPSSEIYPFRYLFIAYNFCIFVIVDRLGRWQPAGAVGKTRLAVFSVLLALTCLTFWSRNRELMPYLTENPNFYGAFSIKDFYRDRILALSGSTRLPVAATPNSVTITPSGRFGERIRLPWLPHEAVERFRFSGARVVAAGPEGGTIIAVTATARPVFITPDDRRRGPLCAAALAVFCALTAGTAGLARWRPGLFTAIPGGGTRHA